MSETRKISINPEFFQNQDDDDTKDLVTSVDDEDDVEFDKEETPSISTSKDSDISPETLETQNVSQQQKDLKTEADLIAWTLIDKYFQENENHLVKHHIDSYNDFIYNGIPRIFRDNNPIRIFHNQDETTKQYRYEVQLYFGGKDGSKIYYGKPVIYDDSSDETEPPRIHYMFPNEARLRNMTYGFSIHYDVDVVCRIYNEDTDTYDEVENTLERIYLGRIPIMLQSDVCILNGMTNEARFNTGECRSDYGGYFIIDGKEKAIVSQEKFADNMLNISDSFSEEYSHAASIRTSSEDPSKPVRTLSVFMVAPTASLKNGNIVVNVPNIRKPVPLFILMRALGVLSDKAIIEMCLLDMEKNSNYVDLFIPSIHDAGPIYTQQDALQYIALLNKGLTIPSTLHILMDYFLPNIGELNFLQKAYYLGYMVYRMLRVYMKDERPTDRDSFKYKRVELTGTLLYDLFLEYFKLQTHDVKVNIDKEYYYHSMEYDGDENYLRLVHNDSNYIQYFRNRILNDGIRKAFKGNWGSKEHTKKVGVVQDLNRLSFFSFLSHLRKLNLPMDSSAKVVKPRLLHSSQWGVVCPVDTPDGGNIGFHKHLSVTAHITAGCSGKPTIEWLRNHGMKVLEELTPKEVSTYTKVFVNGSWVGVIREPKELVDMFRLYRRNGLIPIYNSIQWHIQRNEILIHTDSGRLMRPILYMNQKTNTVSYKKNVFYDILKERKPYSWDMLISGFVEKEVKEYSLKECKIYEPNELYKVKKPYNELGKLKDDVYTFLEQNAGIIEYIDTQESEGALISVEHTGFKDRKATHCEIHPSLILSILGNMIVFPENNQLPRDLFSCGQTKQGVSLYHSNYHNRIDKLGVILNYGQNPIVKSRYLEYVTKEQHPYGENAIVAIMAYTGYNVEDALIFNRGAIERGLFSTTYFNMYEAREESSNVGGGKVDLRFANISEIPQENIVGKKIQYDANYLDEHGLIRENTYMDDKKVVIGLVSSSAVHLDRVVDNSITPKKGQLGYVDKTFITEGEEGQRIAKVRIREERSPAIGDKLCSRAGQKGTVGIILDEQDMPFTADGIRPDLIVNPHALPSRMTIGQLIECLMGKTCAMYGGYGDCTAFVNNGPKHKLFGEMLMRQGYHSSGTEILYNGMTGEQVESEIFIGPTYYLRLKHMVKDKINYRARGPRTQLTRQTVGGRANDGGLRIGEMERDGLISHGMSQFVQESMLVRGDDYYMAICNKTGTIAIYNETKNLFLSPHADGPIQFKQSYENADTLLIDTVSKYGRDFSIVRVPYAFKLLMQELITMNVQMRVITEDNIDQLTGLTYDENQFKLNTGTDNFEELYKVYKELDEGNKAKEQYTKPKREIKPPVPITIPGYQESPPYVATTPDAEYAGVGTPQWQGSPVYVPGTPDAEYAGVGTPQWQGSPVYVPGTPDAEYAGVGTPQWQPSSPTETSPPFVVGTSPEWKPSSPVPPATETSPPFVVGTSLEWKPSSPTETSPPFVVGTSPEWQPSSPVPPATETSPPFVVGTPSPSSLQQGGMIPKDPVSILKVEQPKEETAETGEKSNEKNVSFGEPQEMNREKEEEHQTIESLPIHQKIIIKKLE